MQWVCSREEHSAGGTHYHMAVKLSHARRWLRVRNYLDDNYGIQVNFSANHPNYYSAWKYTTKEDSEYFESPSHPDLANSRSPQTSQASQAKVDKNGSVTTSSRKRKNRLSIYQVSQIAGIKSRLELLVLASRQKKEEKEDLAEFIANRGNKVVDEAIKVGWEMEEAEEKLKRKRMTRLEILQEALKGPCAENCNEQRLELAKDIVKRNNLTDGVFQKAVRELLDKGRGKYRNILVKGSANCCKTFLLNPLNVVYNTFVELPCVTVHRFRFKRRLRSCGFGLHRDRHLSLRGSVSQTLRSEFWTFFLRLMLCFYRVIRTLLFVCYC